MNTKNLISECCAAPPSGPVSHSRNFDGSLIRLGYCSECHEGSAFVYEVEYPDELPPKNGPEE